MRLLAALISSVFAATAIADVSINVPVVGRLTGSTLFRTSIDVSNHTAGAARVRFFLDGSEQTTGQIIAADGSIGPNGTIGTVGSMAPLAPRTNVHFDDFVESLAGAGVLPSSVLANGFLGSVMFVVEVPARSGAAAVTARIYNDLAGGTVGLAIKGREITIQEAQALVAVVSDTRGSGGPQIYPNLFINNMGITANGFGTAGAVSVEISAVSARTGQSVGTPIRIEDLGPGQTAAVNQVLNALQISASSEPAVIVFARVLSGTSAIQGVISQVDVITRDGAVFDMSRGDF
jgi:hypothetical protein